MKNQINNLNKENINLKNENKNLKSEIQNLKDINHSLKTENDRLKTDIKKLKDDNIVINKELNIKNQNINNLKIEIQSLRLSAKNGDVNVRLNDLVSVTFKCLQPIVDYNVIGNKSDKFYTIEEKLYIEHPELMETDIFFMVNGGKINRFKTIQDNHLKNNDKIIINKYVNE